MVKIRGQKRHRKDRGDAILKIEGGVPFVEVENEGYVREDEW